MIYNLAFLAYIYVFLKVEDDFRLIILDCIIIKYGNLLHSHYRFSCMALLFIVCLAELKAWYCTCLALHPLSNSLTYIVVLFSHCQSYRKTH